MALSFSKTNKLFFALGIIFELWFILMYALEYYYLYPVIGTIFQELAYTFNNFQGFLLVLFLLLLFFLGFSLVITYVSGSAYSSTLFGFMILVFTVQYYFIIKSFWIGIGLGNDNYDYSLGTGPYYMISLKTNLWRLNSSYINQMGMTEAIVCAMSMLIAYMALAGRIGGFHIVILCFFGVFFYGFNQICIWRHAIADNAYTMRLFLFGSTFGIATAIALRFRDKLSTSASLGYFASRHTRSYGLLGACFVWLFLPILACIETIYDRSFIGFSITFLFPAIMNMWFALSASAGISFCVSILLDRKIHPHDIVYSSFAVIIFLFQGGIAYGATSILNPDPFPAILCGLLVGIIVTVTNNKLKKRLNNNSIIDTHGVLYTFFLASLFGGLYSAILTAVYPYPTDIPTSVNTFENNGPNQWLPSGRSKIGQGALQVAATFWSIGIGLLSAIAPAIIFYFTTELSPEQIFNDDSFAQISDQHEKNLVVQPAVIQPAAVQPVVRT